MPAPSKVSIFLPFSVFNLPLSIFCFHQKLMGYRRRGSLCSDGQNCLYAEMLDLEECKVGELEEKMEKSVEELAAVKLAHKKFVLEVRRIAETKRHWKSALQVSFNLSYYNRHSKWLRSFMGL